jgi:diketogulonate reductase-like aldo/keto reductase
MDLGIKREELFVCTKLWRDDFTDVEGALRAQCKRLQVDYVDLYMIHWPMPQVDWSDKEMPFKKTPMHMVWAEMERMVELGLTKSIGVSNMLVPALMDMFAYCKIRPVINQIELHPYLCQKELVKFC